MISTYDSVFSFLEPARHSKEKPAGFRRAKLIHRDYNSQLSGNSAIMGENTAETMQPMNLFQLAKLGAHVEYLRGIASVSIIPATSLVEFPQVMANQPETRYGVAKVVETIRALLL